MPRTYHLPSFKNKPVGRLRECARYSAPDDVIQIVLFQRKRDCFAVQYGMQVDDELSYEQACTKLGQALLHSLSCAGAVDNREAR